MKEITVGDIIVEYLKTHDYDGLWNNGECCCCQIEDPASRDYVGLACMPGIIIDYEDKGAVIGPKQNSTNKASTRCDKCKQLKKELDIVRHEAQVLHDIVVRLKYELDELLNNTVGEE